MKRVVGIVQSFHQYAFHVIRSFQDGITGGEGMNGPYAGHMLDLLYQRIIFANGFFFGNVCFHGLAEADADMPPEAEYLAAHRFLETIYKGKGDDHYSYADDGGGGGQPDDEPRERLLLVKCNSAGNKTGYVHNKKL